MKLLLKSLNKLSSAQQFQVGWYFMDLKDGKELSYNGAKTFSAGSVRKLPILVATLNAIKEGKLSLQQPVTIRKKYQNNRSGCFQHLKPGFTITLQDALIMMIVVSDNTCTGAVVDLVGLKKIQKFSNSIGLKKTKFKADFPPLGKEALKKYMDVSSPDDMGLLLNLILKGSQSQEEAKKIGCDKKLCQLAIDFLSWQELNNRLPLLLPTGIKVAHKTGSRRGVQNDVGIIYMEDKPRFILAVFTQGVAKKVKGQPSGRFAECYFIGQLCRMCYDSLK